MIIDICVAVIAVAFVCLVIFLILTLQTTRKTMKQTHRTLWEIHKTLEGISEPGIELIKDLDDLTVDLKKKSEALNVVFKPFMQKEKSEKSHHHEGKSEGLDRIVELAGYVAEGIVLFNKIKDGVKDYVRSR